MQITDLAAAADVAHAHHALLIVDNTFATPFFQQPFAHGADIVFHSATKYLNGHSDVICGVAAVNDDDLAARLQFIHNAAGAVAGPFDSWLVLRGMKTLHLRMPAHDRNGRRIAAWLAERLGHERVRYPGLRSHPQHSLACSQMTGMGGMITVDVGTRERANQVLKKVRIFSLAESLGGVESLISHPASMTHASVPPNGARRSASARGWCGSPAEWKTRTTCCRMSSRRSPDSNAELHMADRKFSPRSRSTAWEHPADRAALQTLRAIPGFDEVVRKVMGLIGERGVRLFFTADAVRVGPRQRPKLDALYTEVLETLD